MNEALKKIYSYQFWRQRIFLEQNYYTPGTIEIELWKQLRLPESLNGKTFLDVGANDGLFSFEAEKRGASKVVASDLYKGSMDTMKNGWSKDGIEMLINYFKSKVTIHEAGIYELESLNEQFDVVLVNNVIVWLEDENDAIKQLAKATKRTLYLADGFLTDNTKPLKVKWSKGPMRYMYNLSYIQSVLEKYGFKIESITPFHNQKVFTKNFITYPQISVKEGTKVYTLPITGSQYKASKAVKDQANSIIGDYYHIAEFGWFHKDEISVHYFKPSKLYTLAKYLGSLNWYYQYLQKKHIKTNGNTAYVIKAVK